MPDPSIERVIQELVDDRELRERFASDPENTLKFFHLTAQQMGALLAINLPLFMELAQEIGHTDGIAHKLI